MDFSFQSVAHSFLLCLVSLALVSAQGPPSLQISPSSTPEYSSFTVQCNYSPTNVSSVVITQNVSSQATAAVMFIVSSNNAALGQNFQTPIGGGGQPNPPPRASAFGNSSVVILSVQSSSTSDSGQYTCSVTDNQGNTRTSSQITLTVTACVAVTATTTGCQNVSVGESCDLTCTPSVSTASVAWYRDPYKLSPQVATGSNLNITSVQQNDFGPYFCFVTTSCTSSSATSITGIGPPPTPFGPGGNVTCSSPNCTEPPPNKFPRWAIAVIVVVIIIIIIIVVILIIYFCIIKKDGKDGEESNEPSNNHRKPPPTATVAAESEEGSRNKKKSRRNEQQDENENSREMNESEKKSKDRRKKSEPAEPVSFPEVTDRKSKLPPLNRPKQGEPERATRRRESDD